MKHPGHTYGGFVPAISERGMTLPQMFWSQIGESQVFGPEVLKDAEKQVQMVRESLKVAQSR
jgi:hypothetical protein